MSGLARNVVSDMGVGDRGGDRGLFYQSIEQHPPRSRAAAIESEHELVEVVVDMPRVHCTVVGSEQPALQQRGDSANPRQGGMCRHGRTQLNPRIVIYPVPRKPRIDARAVCSHAGNGLNVVKDEWLQTVDSR
jgi:hypothetical protein